MHQPNAASSAADDGGAESPAWPLKDRIAHCLLSAYDRLPPRGKPQGKEWTVLAGFVLAWSDGTSPDHDDTAAAAAAPAAAVSPLSVRCVALATGNRCVGRSRMSTQGHVVNDCHAEVLARRRLRAVIARDVRATFTGGETVLLESTPPGAHATPTERPRLRLRPGYSLHLCVTETPCGDASIYADENPGGSEGGSGARRTGAKPSGLTCCDDHGSRNQDVGVLRTKSARSDMPSTLRTASMSCSDKIALWALVGLEGSLLSHFVEPVPLSSVTMLLEDGAATPAAASASARALRDRFSAVRHSCALNTPYPLPPLQVWFSSKRAGCFLRCRAAVEGHSRNELAAAASASSSSPAPFFSPDAAGKSCTKRKQRPPKLSTPCGYALHWAVGPTRDSEAAEVLISARGVLQGATATAAKKRKKRAQQPRDGALASQQRRSVAAVAAPSPPPRSMLCKASVFAEWLSLAREWGLGCLPEAAAGSLTYRVAKRLPSSNRMAKDTILAHPLLRNWLSADSAALEGFLPA